MPSADKIMRARGRRALVSSRSRSIAALYWGMRRGIFVVLLFLTANAFCQDAPAWFANSLLHLPDDVAEAAKEGKRVMLYFEQNGCPYCKRMVEVNFADPKIA